MGRALVTVDIAAPAVRVWRALTDPAEVEAWDGSVPLDVPAGYPRPGQHARWGTRVGPLRLTLHDRVTAVEPGLRLAAALRVGPVRMAEEYRLAEGAGGGCRLVCVIRVTPLGTRWVRRSARAAMARLRAHCQDTP